MTYINLINFNSASALRTFLKEEGLGMQKKFGQNFLINPAIRQSLVESLNCEAESEVWEIGPGLGAMTALLLEKGLKVRAFEIDIGFINVLKRMFINEKNFTLVEGDVLKTWKTQNQDFSKNFFLLGNLPYNIAAALLADFIENGLLFSRMVVTVQKEVALRMAAKAGSKDYSSFSVLCASAYKVKTLMTIHPQSFFPQPNVDSMGVLLEKHPVFEGALEKQIPAVFYPLVRALFASRRKTIKNNLTSFISSCLKKFNSTDAESTKSSQDICIELLRKNGIAENERAENLEADIFLSLAKYIENMRIL
jgi:16S rRNA (adenine1518-N6/adenine1519-N6)-dimethyltransferase